MKKTKIKGMTTKKKYSTKMKYSVMEEKKTSKVKWKNKGKG